MKITKIKFDDGTEFNVCLTLDQYSFLSPFITNYDNLKCILTLLGNEEVPNSQVFQIMQYFKTKIELFQIPFIEFERQPIKEKTTKPYFRQNERW